MSKSVVNRVMARKELIKRMDESIREAEKERWLLSPDGQAYLAKKEQDRQIALIRQDIKLGQLVWKGVVIENSDPMSEDRLGSRCSKIIAINEHDNTVESEMLFVDIKGEKKEGYQDWANGWSKKGDVFTTNIIEMEKHVAKNGNIWWRIKIA